MSEYYVLEYVFNPGYFVSLRDKEFPAKTKDIRSITYWDNSHHCLNYLNLMYESYFKSNPVTIKKVRLLIEDIE
jgi:hypothetical protein